MYLGPIFVGKLRPYEDAWRLIRLSLYYTEERFNALVEKRRREYDDAVRGNDRKTVQSLERAWRDICDARRMRDELMENGWLPPRERDILAMRSKVGGALFAGMPTKWALNRKYEYDEVPISLQRFYTDE